MVNSYQPNTKKLQPTTHAIRMLNDQFRVHGIGNGSMYVTAGIIGLGEAFAASAVKEVRTFTNFTPDNDPHGEHDCATVQVNGETVIWKIDYYDKSMNMGSENPADDSTTHRVLTIMLATEY
jgi:hypothetical protein